MTVEVAAAVIGIFFAACTAFNYVVIRPLSDAISELRSLIGEMRREMRVNEEKRQAMDMRLARVEESTKAAHKRIDELNDARCSTVYGDV